MSTNDSLSRLSDTELLIEVKRLAAIERVATADLICSLAEVEARRLHFASGCSSMFGYSTQVLHLSEHAAYARIAAARVATQFPVVMNLLMEGAITLTTVTLLGRHLTAENHAALLDSARHKSKADVEMLVATLHPQPDVPSSVRKLPKPDEASATPPLLSEVAESIAACPPERSARRRIPQATTPEPPTAPPPSPAAVVRPVAPDRYRLQVTIGNCAVLRTTCTKPSSGSGPCSCGRPATRGVELGLDQVPCRVRAVVEPDPAATLNRVGGTRAPAFRRPAVTGDFVAAPVF